MNKYKPLKNLIRFSMSRILLTLFMAFVSHAEILYKKSLPHPCKRSKKIKVTCQLDSRNNQALIIKKRKLKKFLRSCEVIPKFARKFKKEKKACENFIERNDPIPTNTPNSAPSEKIFYVSPNGSDSFDGTELTPFKSLSRARDAVRDYGQSATVLLRGGEYQLDQTFQLNNLDSGTLLSPNVYKNYPGETPVLVGTKKVQTTVGQNGFQIYTLQDIPNNGITQVFLNEQILTKARFPKEMIDFQNEDPYLGSFLYVASTQPDCIENPTQTSLKFDSNLLNTSNWSDLSGAEARIWPNFNYVSSTLKIESVLPGELRFVGNSWGPICEDNRFFIQGIPELVTEPGEWAYYSDKLKVYLPKQLSINDTLSIPAFYGSAIEINNASNIVINGIEIKHINGNGISISNSNQILIEGVKVSHTFGNGFGQFGFQTPNGNEGTGIQVWSSEKIVIKNNIISDTASSGISLLNSSEKIKNLSLDNNVVSHNKITSPAKFYSHHAGIWVESYGSRISNNYITDAPKAGIMGFPVLTEISFNHIERSGLEICDIGSIYIAGTSWLQGRNNLIKNNFIKDSGGYCFNDSEGKWQFHKTSWGVYLDDGASFNSVSDNIVVDAAEACYINNLGKGNSFINNICYLPRTGSGFNLNGNLGALYEKFYNDVRDLAINGYNKSAYEANFQDLINIPPPPWKNEYAQVGTRVENNITVGRRLQNRFTVEVRNINNNLTEIDSNTYFDPSGAPIRFNSGFFDEPLGNYFEPKTFSQWQLKNYDINGKIEDPNFIDPSNNNFCLRSKSSRFNEIDLSKTGLNGIAPKCGDANY